MEIKVRAITLKSVDYKDSDKILTLFTLERGKITVSARGVRKSGAKFRAIAEPFCFADVVLAGKGGRYTVKEMTAVDTFYPLITDMKKYYAGFCALEFAAAFSQEELVAEELFVRLVSFLKDLCYGDAAAEDLLIKFFHDALKTEGYSISFSGCGRCGCEIERKVFLSLSGGYCVCEKCRATGEKEFSIKTYGYLRRTVSGEGVYDAALAANALRFFGYYMAEATGVTLRSLTALVNGDK
ncbi:MAG: DNA repair protein RecO [Clostridia bacterium]|nr:DNA repair protein RecO [Clostridia bacterium]